MNKQLDIEAIQACTTYKELEKEVDLTEVVRALVARETQRLAHKRYTQKKQLVLERAKKLMEEKPELFADIEA
jgi:hypothetical protein